MANGDVDAINERLNGLVNLLQVVGIDGVDPDALVNQEQQRGSNRAAAARSSGNSDAQILEIIKKLQLAQADSPEILAALKSPELRALASLAAQKQQAAGAPQQQQQHHHHRQKAPEKAPAPSLDDVMDDDDNYPKIGPGYSDDISVVSDMTTPTVMTKQNVAEEEYYREVNGGPGALPPIHAIGGGPAQPARPSLGGPTLSGGVHHHGGKTKNMVGQVRPGAARRAIAKSGGAAAQRRLNYQMAMTKLQSKPSASHAAAGGDQDHFSPKKQTKDSFTPTSPTPSQQSPMEFPSMVADGPGSGGKNSKKGKEKLSSKKGRKTALAAQEVDDLDFEGTEPVRTPATSATSGSTASGGKKKTNDIDWGTSGADNGWPAFDAGKTGGGKDIFVDNDGFFPNDAFPSSDGFGSPAPAPAPATSHASRSAKSPTKQPPPKQKSSGSISVNRKTSSRGEGRKTSSSSSSRSKSDADKKKEKDKAAKKKTRRTTLSM